MPVSENQSTLMHREPRVAAADYYCQQNMILVVYNIFREIFYLSLIMAIWRFFTLIQTINLDRKSTKWDLIKIWFNKNLGKEIFLNATLN